MEDSNILFGYFMTVLDFLNFLAFNKAMDKFHYVFLHKERTVKNNTELSVASSIVNVPENASENEPTRKVTNVSENSTSTPPPNSETKFQKAAKTVMKTNISDSTVLPGAFRSGLKGSNIMFNKIEF